MVYSVPDCDRDSAALEVVVGEQTSSETGHHVIVIVSAIAIESSTDSNWPIVSSSIVWRFPF